MLVGAEAVVESGGVINLVSSASLSAEIIQLYFRNTMLMYPSCTEVHILAELLCVTENDVSTMRVAPFESSRFDDFAD